jgi:excisionase family DNA binding protein
MRGLSNPARTAEQFANRGAFSVNEFCDYFGICRQTFYDELKRGHLQAHKIGAKTVILKSDAEAWLKSLPRLGGEAA